MKYFIRDDDVGELTPSLRFFVELFISQRLPVSYQIIPANLTAECAAFMLATQAAYPDLVEFGQHGLHHHMLVGGRQVNREFGPERPYVEQREVIDEGMRLLRQKLGADVRIDVFTPPQHKFDRSTVRCAIEAGHRTFSASFYPSSRHQAAYAVGRSLRLSSIRHHGISYDGRRRPEGDIVERSISIAIDDYTNIKQQPAILPAAIAASERRTDAVGFMLHHECYHDAERRVALSKLVAALAMQGSEKFRLLGELGAA